MASNVVPSAPSLDEALSRIRSSPKLQSQQHSAVVLSAVEDTLRGQKSQFTPTAYFAALLALLNQYASTSASAVNKDTSTAVVYLLDLVTPHVPPALLRSKFSAIVSSLGPALTSPDADAPFLRSAIGCLISLLVAQDAHSWSLPQNQLGPRQALGGLLALAVDPRPKVRKKAQDGLATVLKNSPPSPSLDHPAADMCAETALQTFQELASSSDSTKATKADRDSQKHNPMLIHTMQLIKTVASACKGWPSRNLESLCEVLFRVAKSKAEFLTIAAFDVFEAILEGMAKAQSFDKLPRLLEAIMELEPAKTDTQLLPPWLAVLSRGYDVSAQMEPEETFQNLPKVFNTITSFLESASYNIRVSASECLVSLFVNCIPSKVLLDPSVYDEKVLEKLSNSLTDLLSVKFQASWKEVFNVLVAAFDALRWHSAKYLVNIVATIGELRGNEAFAGKAEADEILKRAITAMGPGPVLDVLPLNLHKPIRGSPGRAWLLPLLRDSVRNTNLSHFRKELVPLSEVMFQNVTDNSGAERSMETKIFETVIQQIWSTLPGYCDQTLDIVDSFDQSFAEMLANLLYQYPEMRTVISKSLQNLVDTTKITANISGDEDLLLQGRISKSDARKSIEHLASFTSNLLAVLFNVYVETSSQSRGPILSCIDSYLSIMSPNEIADTFTRVATAFEGCIKDELAQKENQKPRQHPEKSSTGLMSHSLMDIVVVIAMYLPRDSFHSLFSLAAVVISQKQDAQLQKKAYKLIPRLALSETGRMALKERNHELCQLVLNNAGMLMNPAKRDRLSATAEIVKTLPDDSLYFIPCILPEVILCTKEKNERARNMAFDLIVEMGERIRAGGVIDSGKFGGEAGSSAKAQATMDEYFTMLAAGLAGSSPHLTSASITAISRALFEFKESISENVVTELVSTVDLFLKSPSREIVGSVLGFVKVSIISLPETMISLRLGSLIPALLGWSHEHKGRFRTKVKNILERLVRRFGAEVVERHCPEEDRKLITNIRKTRERRKRKKAAAADGQDAENTETQDSIKSKGKFESEYDEAIYGSDDSASLESSSDEEDGGGVTLRNGSAKTGKAKKNQTYIVEDDDEPLDLLDRKSLARISTTKPVKTKTPPDRKQRAKTDLDGKLVLGGDEEDDDMDAADAEEADDAELADGVNAYVEAMRGKDAAQRGQRGRLKFKNNRSKGEENMDMDDNNEDGDQNGDGEAAAKRHHRGGHKGRIASGRGGAPGRGGMKFKSGFAKGKMQRRGLGVQKARGGGDRVMKGGRGHAASMRRR